MSIINKHNYEAFYLDYIEGNLSKEDTAQLLLFLEQNPELKAELEEFEMIELQPEPSIIFEKETLKQTINENNIEDYIIASLEKQTTPEDELELQAFLKKTPKAQKLAERYKKTILPELKITYPNKNRLKKNGTIVYYLTPIASVAAVLMVFFLLKSPSDTQTNNSMQIQVAKTETEVSNSTDRVLPESSAVVKVTMDKKEKAEDLIVKATQEDEIKIAAIEHAVNNEPEKEQKVEEKKADIEERNIKPIEAIETEIEIATLEPDNIEEVQIENAIPQVNTEEGLYTNNKESQEEIFIEEGKENKPIFYKPEINKKVLAYQQQTTSKATNESLTVGQWIFKGVWEKVFKDDAPETQEMGRTELLAAVAEQLDENSKRDIAFSYNTNNDRTSYNLKLGGLEISRSKRN